MIKLLNEMDFIPLKDFNVKELNLKKSIFEIIKEKLVVASGKHELIYTCELRGIGKTYSLIKFAKLHNYLVVVDSTVVAENLKKHYKFPYIYSQQQVFNKELTNNNGILIDEGVDFKRINDEGHYNIITGFSYIYVNEHCDKQKTKSIQEQVIENLQEEIKSLSKIITRTRENGDYGTYKNLINSLKGVLELYNNETKKDHSNINTNISLNLNDVITIDSNGRIEVKNASIYKTLDVKELTENVLKELNYQLNKKGLNI